jgi:C-terminal processing protease CtpA/Prc
MMKKSSIVTLCVLFSFLCQSANAQVKSLFKDVDKLYDELSVSFDVHKDSVRYTGDDFSIAKDGFLMMRKPGAGWTKGMRLCFKNGDVRHEKKLVKVFNELQQKKIFVVTASAMSASIDDATNTVYAYGHSKDGSLYFLKAHSTGNISLPMCWMEVDELDATDKSKPFLRKNKSDVSEATLRSLALARLWAGVKSNFVFYSRMKADWDSLYVATLPQMLAAKDREECRRVMQRMIAHCNDGHTFVQGNISKPATPLLLKMLEDRAYVDDVQSQILVDMGIRRGMELTHINGIPVKEYGKKNVMPYVAASTNQWRNRITFESYDLLRCAVGETLRLDFVHDGRKKSVKYVGGSAPFDLLNQKPVISFTEIKKGIGLLTIRDFWRSNIREEFDKAFESISKTKALIVDIRGNGGGNSGNSEYILRHLTDKQIVSSSWKSPLYIPAFASWGRELEEYSSKGNVINPIVGKEAYTRPIVLLVDAGTFSAAEDFAVMFMGIRRGEVVGTPTGGSTGNGVRVTLFEDDGSFANICSKHDTAPDGTEFVGYGIRPTIVVGETYKSHFKDKHDATMTKALEILTAR